MLYQGILYHNLRFFAMTLVFSHRFEPCIGFWITSGFFVDEFGLVC